MKTEEIANNLVTWFNNNEEARCYQELYSPNIVSVEATGEYPTAKGMEEIAKKGEWWNETFEVHSSNASQPIVADNWFSVRFDMDTTHKESGQRSQMSEIGVYQVKDGKIVKEQFFYDSE
ncbi:nuclear transport factor 2 family protein [Ulvibacter litoralis]|uniref:SnoaL-like domain-containing protein n=1 Tax=Ulvibacter litoralis TaxID=227084 RepID=A0A1G7DHN8_9FLAO|nr:nuclear transport factor 2 family protein [Ulvibacter litoralis]GHC43376.1 ketosteroid isomerase [Ulvibacter litoralis]SDE51074.1 SnoaL-like domain-containing protein [Ulvibacter litoralis]